MTGRVSRVLSWVVMAVLIIQVVFPGGLFDFAVQRTYAATTLGISAPIASTEWVIGENNTILWTTVGDVPSYFKLYYSTDSGGNWASIDDYEAYTGSPQFYLWTTPVVANAGSQTHQVKVEAYDAGDVLLATKSTVSYIIDYGPLDSFVVDVEPQISEGLSVYLDATAKDQYDNTILNFSDSGMVTQGYVRIDGMGVPNVMVTVNGDSNLTNGDGLFSIVQPQPSGWSWANGHAQIVTYFTYDEGNIGDGGGTISYDLNAKGNDTTNVVANLVLMDAPTSASSFVIGSPGNSITFRAGGETSIDHLDLAYSPNNGGNYYTIENGVADGAMPQTYSWIVNNDTPGAQWKVRVQSYDATDTLIATGTSDAFTVAYGAVASFTVAAPETANINQYFSLTVTAKDTYGNTITTFSEATAIGSLPSNITPTTIGNGTTTGTWSNGVVTYNGYQISGTGVQTITATYGSATGSDTMNIIGGGSTTVIGCTESMDKKAPASAVVGILDANNIIQPMPATTYKTPMTVVAEAIDPDQGLVADGCPLGTGVAAIDLQLKKGAGEYIAQSGGMYMVPPANAKPGYDYYKWIIDIPAKEFTTYYFYSLATDYDGNAETAPSMPGYDTLTLVDMRRPYVISTNPLNSQTGVANNMPIQVVFNMPMNTASVWSAFSITKQGAVVPVDLRWSAVWSNNNQVASFRHATVFDYSGVYTVKIDPDIATNASGAPLDITNPDAAPMPFSFTVAAGPQTNRPYLATSTKVVNLAIAPVGSLLTYTIVLRNTGTATANVVFTDPIPVNTTYDNMVTNAVYDAVAKTIRWSGTIARGRTWTITFRVKINTGVANGTVIENKATFSDGAGNTFDRYANTTVNTVPTSKVIGNLVDGTLITPMQGYTYASPLTVVAQAPNASSLLTVNLYYRTSATGDTVYKNFGPGTKYQDLPDGSAYYKWDFPFAEGISLTYYFYTRATDSYGNIENAPSSYDAYTRVNTIRPYITLTTPVHNAVNVPISGTSSYVRLTFSAAMDRASVISAFNFSRVDGKPVPDFQWVATWNTSSTQIILRHASVPFEYKTQYQVSVDPAIAKDAKGKYLNNADSRSKPNPFTFTTAIKQAPDLTASVKLVDSPTVQPGALLLFTIKVDNSLGTVSARVTLTDPLPANTTYANYRFGGLNYNATTKIFSWSGTVLAGASQTMGFQVRVNTPLDNNLNITNTVTLKDQTNPAIAKQAISIVGSTPNWATSYLKVDLPPERTDGKVKPGDTITYTTYIANTGDMNVSNLAVVTDVPNHTKYVDGSATGGLVYDSATDTLQWTGVLNVNQNKTFTYQIKLNNNPDEFKAPNNKVFTQIDLADGVDGYVMENTTMVDVPEDTTIKPPRPNPAPYITDQIQPAMNATSVKLLSSVVVPFSETMNTDFLQYEVMLGDLQVDVSKWEATWSETGEQVTLTPPAPLDSGEIYTIHILEALDLQGSGLITDGPVPDNTWKFTTVRPMLTFSQPEGPVSFLAGQVSQEIILKVVDWINFNALGESPAYLPYTVEGMQDLVLNLETTSTTGRMGATPTGPFYTKTWGPWSGKPADPNAYLKIPVGGDAASFYYTDVEIGFNSLMAADSNTQGYVVIDPERKPVITSTTSSDIDQIYFGSDPQRIPVSSFSNPIIFGITNRDKQVELEEGRSFLLHSTSTTGRFYTSDKNLITEEYVANTNQGRQVFYRHYIRTTTMTETIYYKDSTPGSYSLTIADGNSELGVAGVVIQAGIAQSTGQSMIVLPLDITDCEEGDCELDELIPVDDDSGRVLDKIVITPQDVTLVPGAAKIFSATGYDQDGQEINELVFSWYVIAGGGTILKAGSIDNNHNSRFIAGKIPGVYYDTVMVAAYYNGNILADNATVRVARVINYGAPGTLPSTGPNGIQLLFMILTLISAVALAAVEHYEKTYLTKKQQPAR
ncbi:MAG: Ig-like domain-containing protein [Patescibacteria group bacterium]|jgi:uncharacterized repeat protein (TIGR01451 family)